MDKTSLSWRILLCPDCQAELDAALSCPSCGRSMAPEEDGIISALPKQMKAVDRSKDQIQAEIDATGADAEKVVQFERAFHDEQASYYDKVFADPLPLREYYKRMVRRQIYSYVQQQPFVVDLCCGTGKGSMPLVERGIQVVGIDVSRECSVPTVERWPAVTTSSSCTQMPRIRRCGSDHAAQLP